MIFENFAVVAIERASVDKSCVIMTVEKVTVDKLYVLSSFEKVTVDESYINLREPIEQYTTTTSWMCVFKLISRTKICAARIPLQYQQKIKPKLSTISVRGPA